MDARIALDEVLALSARLSRESPFEGGAGELCGQLAFLSAAQGLALFAVDDETDEAELLGAYGLAVEYVRRFPPRERRGLAQLPGDLREAVNRAELVIVPDLADDPRTLSLTSVARQSMFDVTVSVPLALDGTIFGVVHAFYTGTPPAAPIELLMGVGHAVAGAIVRDRMGAALRANQNAARPPAEDPEGLYSRIQIQRLARHAHAVADRYDGQYSVVVYCVDHPERLMLRYGRALIDDAVVHLGACVTEESRGSDLVGRLSESSVLAVMPSTNEGGAFSQCERTLTRFGRHAFRHGETRLQLSASAGVSYFPGNGSLDAAATVRSAEAALHSAIGENGQRIITLAARGSAAP